MKGLKCLLIGLTSATLFFGLSMEANAEEAIGESFDQAVYTFTEVDGQMYVSVNEGEAVVTDGVINATGTGYDSKIYVESGEVTVQFTDFTMVNSTDSVIDVGEGAVCHVIFTGENHFVLNYSDKSLFHVPAGARIDIDGSGSALFSCGENVRGSAVIGGDEFEPNGVININGSDISIFGNSNSALIGCGVSSFGFPGTITVNGGNLVLHNSNVIFGSSIYPAYGSCIGGGMAQQMGENNIVINGGTQKLFSEDSPVIGVCDQSNAHTSFFMTGGNLSATSVGSVAIGMNNSWEDGHMDMRILGGTLYAKSPCEKGAVGTNDIHFSFICAEFENVHVDDSDIHEVRIYPGSEEEKLIPGEEHENVFPGNEEVVDVPENDQEAVDAPENDQEVVDAPENDQEDADAPENDQEVVAPGNEEDVDAPEIDDETIVSGNENGTEVSDEDPDVSDEDDEMKSDDQEQIEDDRVSGDDGEQIMDPDALEKDDVVIEDETEKETSEEVVTGTAGVGSVVKTIGAVIRKTIRVIISRIFKR